MTHVHNSPSGRVLDVPVLFDSCADVRLQAEKARQYATILVKNRGLFFQTTVTGTDSLNELTDYIKLEHVGYALEQRAYGDYAYIGTPPYKAGRVYWDGDSWNCMTEFSDVTLQLGEENQILVVNDESVTALNGQVVYASSAQGQRLATMLYANTNENAGRVLGLYTHSVPAHQNGRVTNFGLVRDLNTLGLTVALPIYTSATPGAFTQTKPPGTVEAYELGIVVQAHPTNGSIFVRTRKLERQMGTSVARPSNPRGGDFYLDSNLNKPIWWNGSNWIDATGASV